MKLRKLQIKGNENKNLQNNSMLTYLNRIDKLYNKTIYSIKKFKSKRKINKQYNQFKNDLDTTITLLRKYRRGN